MAFDTELRDRLLDRLSPLGPVSARSMFGGTGLYLNGVIFGLIARDALYFKVGPRNRADYDAMDCESFVPFPEKPYPMSYRRVPEPVIADAEELCRWAGKAAEESRRLTAERGKHA